MFSLLRKKIIVLPKIVVQFQMNLNDGFKIIILNFLKTTEVGPGNKAFIARLGGGFFWTMTAGGIKAFPDAFFRRDDISSKLSEDF